MPCTAVADPGVGMEVVHYATRERAQGYERRISCLCHCHRHRHCSTLSQQLRRWKRKCEEQVPSGSNSAISQTARVAGGNEGGVAWRGLWVQGWQWRWCTGFCEEVQGWQ